ncbi:hypothetical protein ATCV1_z608L [Acanthocystis turfacea chlorella virus 1]|uniref:Uncharacterized protein z608L n=1 Tax=Chlorovirus heliozoae TaxID=322019 RepID=A7K9L8_9PHYC|nr:hypothetical protein ATCV1_z608L [Acanthocystis turfacea chlorella virus 1]ABT16742.1 hypothetical protein ATCV1_z608L [Acanthocystis turfacea chlorella virus 1]
MHRVYDSRNLIFLCHIARFLCIVCSLYCDNLAGLFIFRLPHFGAPSTANTLAKSVFFEYTANCCGILAYNHLWAKAAEKHFTFSCVTNSCIT